MPSIKSNFIFGSDFCRKFGIIIDFKENRWEVKNPQHSSIISEIKSINNDLGSIKVIRNWENLKQGKIEKVTEALKGLQKIRSSDRLGRTNKMIYTIDTGDAKPVKQRQYLMSPYMLSHLNKELDKMIELDVVEPSQSPWSSPVLLVKKANNEYRFCFDSRKLNSVTKKMLTHYQ